MSLAAEWAAQNIRSVLCTAVSCFLTASSTSLKSCLLLANLVLLFVQPEADCSGDRRHPHSKSWPLPSPSLSLPETLGRPCSLQSFPSRDVSNLESKLILLRPLLDQATYGPNPNYIIFSCQTSFHWVKMLLISHRNAILISTRWIWGRVVDGLLFPQLWCQKNHMKVFTRWVEGLSRYILLWFQREKWKHGDWGVKGEESTGSRADIAAALVLGTILWLLCIWLMSKIGFEGLKCYV